MRSFAASVLFLLALPAGCTDAQTWRAVDRMIQSSFPKVPTLTTDSLAERLADSSRTVLLDARAPEEYAVSHLRGARRVDPAATQFPMLDTLPRDTPIVVYCSVGYRSARVAARLRARGFGNVANLKGSIFRWANEGRPVVRGDSVVRAVHPYDDTWGRLLDEDLHVLSPPQ
ncbi:MAG: rhodanese-like domain-containing protein [Salinibacter sp.]